MNNTATIIIKFKMSATVTGGWLSGHIRRLPEGAPVQNALQDCPLNCSPAPHQSLIGRESQEDYKSSWLRGVHKEVQLTAQEAWTAAAG